MHGWCSPQRVRPAPACSGGAVRCGALLRAAIRRCAGASRPVRAMRGGSERWGLSSRAFVPCNSLSLLCSAYTLSRGLAAAPVRSGDVPVSGPRRWRVGGASMPQGQRHRVTGLEGHALTRHARTRSPTAWRVMRCCPPHRRRRHCEPTRPAVCPVAQPSTASLPQRSTRSSSRQHGPSMDPAVR